MSLQWRLLNLSCTLDRCRLQSPALQIAMTRSTHVHAGTPPKHTEPVSAIRPAGTSPRTAILTGLAGSSLVPVIRPDLDPKLIG